MNILEQYSDASKMLSDMNLKQGSYISLLENITCIIRKIRLVENS